ncbi:hypothetical protein GCM10023231_37210 [Olivibacter ginsenosidimutans]|uniref:Sugar phosphate isomerase/epimerase n=1 Tax=Olivibacter ginsenosidimutans TaxID=1176537 RepID=A0ABP9C920_9SPHI
MEIKFLCPRWGFESLAWEDFLAQVKDAGYAGIEWFPQGGKPEIEQVSDLLVRYQLEHAIVMEIARPFTGFDDYLFHLQQDLDILLGTLAAIKSPLFLSIQTGREFFSIPEIEACIQVCTDMQDKHNIAIYQETHRNKWSYAAHITGAVLRQHQALCLTLDISHWYCVSESYLLDQQETVQLAVKHARHIHARVGHTEGPQVIDPAFDEYREALDHHLQIWDMWIAHMTSLQKTFCTITPEFGPPPYLSVAGRALDPLQEQWRLNLWIKNLLQNRYHDE